MCGGGWWWEWYCRFALIGSPAGSLGWKGLEVCASLVLQCILRCWSSAIPLYRVLPAITATLGVRDNDPSYPVEFVVTSIEVDNFLLRTILSSIEIKQLSPCKSIPQPSNRAKSFSEQVSFHTGISTYLIITIHIYRFHR